MAIVGLTVSVDGQPIQRLAVSTKVSIGEVKKTANGKTYPSKLDHFVFLQKSIDLGWEPDKELSEFYGKECRSFWVFFMSDDLESVFRTQLAWWSATEKKCWGDGVAATRRTEKNPDGEPWVCGDKCPEFDGPCKPSGDLYFRLVDFPRIGATCRIHTSGKRSVMQICSALTELQGMTGGRLMGVKAKLVVRPEKTSYFDEKEKKKKSTVIYALNLEHDRKESMQELIGNMTEYSRLFERTQKLLGPGQVVIDDDPEAERAAELQPEFYPAEDIKPAATPVIAQPARASAPIVPEVMPKTNGGPAIITREQRIHFKNVAVEGGWGTEQIKDLLREHWGFNNSADITVDKYDVICKSFKDGVMPVILKGDASEPTDANEFHATDEDIPF